MKPPARTLVLLLGAAMAAGCASAVPEAIRKPPPDAPTVAQVRESPGCCTGRAVRWGGRILGVENRAKETRITVLALPLAADGEPLEGDVTRGRFIARFDGFLDPALFPQGRRLTVTGTVAGTETVPVGEYPYVHPLVDARDYHLWPEPEPYPEYLDPWYPWYPWYPWAPCPYPCPVGPHLH